MSIYRKALLNKDGLETTMACQYVWGARQGHRDELILRDRDATTSSSESSGEFLNERQWCLMDYYDPISIVDNSGAVLERYRFSAFGLRSVMAADFSPRITSDYDWNFAFKGQFLDLDTGYYNYGYRYYSPDLGRWLSRDPIGEKGGNNLFAFTVNNPINFHDILGLVLIHQLSSLVITTPAQGKGGVTRPEIINVRLTSQPAAQPGSCTLQFTEVYWQIRAYVGPPQLWNEYPNGFDIQNYIFCKNRIPGKDRYNCAEGLSYQGVVVHESTHVQQFESIAVQLTTALKKAYSVCKTLPCTEADQLKKQLESNPPEEMDRAIYFPIFKASFPPKGGFTDNDIPGPGEYEANVAEWNYYNTLIR